MRNPRIVPGLQRLVAVRMGAALTLALLYSGCSFVPNEANPVEWYKGVREWVADKKTEEQELAERKARNTPIPGADKPFPNLGTIPERPPRPDAKASGRATESLKKDRDKSRAADTSLRLEKIEPGEDAATAPAPRGKKLRMPPPPEPEIKLKRPPPPPVIAPLPDVDAPTGAGEQGSLTGQPGSRFAHRPDHGAGLDRPPLVLLADDGRTAPIVATPARLGPSYKPLRPIATGGGPESPVTKLTVPELLPPGVRAPSSSRGTPAKVRLPTRPLTGLRFGRPPPDIDPDHGRAKVRKRPKESQPAVSAVAPPTPATRRSGPAPISSRPLTGVQFGAPPRDIEVARGIEAELPRRARKPAPRPARKVAVVLFEAESAVVAPAGQRALRKMVTRLHRRGRKVRVVGHASATATEVDPIRGRMSSLSLSIDRAKAVVEFLISLGIDPKSISITASTELPPAAEKSAPSNEAQNHRVEVFME